MSDNVKTYASFIAEQMRILKGKGLVSEAKAKKPWKAPHEVDTGPQEVDPQTHWNKHVAPHYKNGIKDHEKLDKAIDAHIVKYGKNHAYNTKNRAEIKAVLPKRAYEPDAPEHESEAKKHWKTQVAPHYKNGPTPEFARAVDDHVKKYGSHQVYNHHSSDGGSAPSWFDSHHDRMKPLKKTSGYTTD